MNNMVLRRATPTVAQKSLRISLCVAALALLFCLYTWGISQNPRGFYLDESATAYNAYLVSRTGAGEFGPRFPVLFQQFAVSNATYMNPLAIYLLAIVFRFVPRALLWHGCPRHSGCSRRVCCLACWQSAFPASVRSALSLPAVR